MYNVLLWFLSVFVVGILINVVSAYAMPYIDKFLARFSDYQRIRSEKKRGEIDREVQRMLADHDYYLYKLSEKTTELLSLYVHLALLMFLLAAPSIRIGLISYLGEVEKGITNSSYPQVFFQKFFDFRHDASFSMGMDFTIWVSFLLVMVIFLFSRLAHNQRNTIVINEYFRQKNRSHITPST